MKWAATAMKAIYCVVAVLLSVSCVYTVSATLPSPENVTLHTLNTEYVLRWVWPRGLLENQSVTFMAQYIQEYILVRKSVTWIMMCENIIKTQCDFTSVNLHYWGTYVFRVRANRGMESSEWVLKKFCPDRDANLGPPSRVDLSVEGSYLTVKIYTPLTSTNTSMAEIVYGLYYRIQYWKSVGQTTDYIYKNATLNTVTLSNLEPWTLYCVRVQSRQEYYKKSSVFSTTQCRKTSGQLTSWQILVSFLISMLVCFLLVLLVSAVVLKFYWMIKGTFFPSCQVPSSLHEYLCDSPSSLGQASLLTFESEAEICLKKLEISPVEVQAAIEAMPWHSYQDIGDHQDSGDSGVYSAEVQLEWSAEAQE